MSKYQTALILLVGLVVVLIIGYFAGGLRPGGAPKQVSDSVSKIIEGDTRGGAAVTTLADHERKFLVWLLRKRADAGFETVPVRHRATAEGACDECFTIYYAWDNGTARLSVDHDEVLAAIDSDGFDYVIQSQKEPVEFTELESL